MISLFLTFLSSLAMALPNKCYSLKDLNNEGCRAACVESGYFSGEFKKGQCYCLDKGHYKAKKLDLGTIRSLDLDDYYGY